MQPITGDCLVHQMVCQGIVGFEIGDSANFCQPVLNGVSVDVKSCGGAFYIAVLIQVKHGEGFQKCLAVRVLQQRLQNIVADTEGIFLFPAKGFALVRK